MGKDEYQNLNINFDDPTFWLAEVDLDTGSYINECVIDRCFYEEILTILNLKKTEIEIGISFDLNTTEFARVSKAIGEKPLNPNGSGVLSVNPCGLSLSCEAHTNKELVLMLNSGKPLSVFMYVNEEEREETIIQNFDRYVDRGKIFRMIRKFQSDVFDEVLTYELFVNEGEEWRADAYMLFVDAVEKMGYSPYLGWIESRLLGYSTESCKNFWGGEFDFVKKKLF